MAAEMIAPKRSWSHWLAGGLILATPALLPAEDFKLRDGQEYRGATVGRTEPDGIVIVTKTGVIKLNFAELPEETQQKYHYDPAAAEAYAKAQSVKQRALSEQLDRAQGAAIAAPTPVSQTPVMAPPKQPASIPGKGIVLGLTWDGPLQGGSETIKDLDLLFSPHAKPALNVEPAAIEIYQGVMYLTPLFQAAAQLGLQGIKSKSAVVCPGIPKNSFFTYAFDGNFDGEYNRLYFVTDTSDQVVSIQLVAETPRNRRPKGQADWYCYNFINYKVKAANDVHVYHDLTPQQNGAVLRVDSVLWTPMKRYRGLKGGYDFKVTEAVRWFVPRPFAELILLNVKKITLRR